jgi:sulfur carrier protein ThiS
MMCVLVNSEPREVSSPNVDSLLSEIDYEGTHFAIALDFDVPPKQPLGGDADQEWRRDRDHHAAAGRVR